MRTANGFGLRTPDADGCEDPLPSRNPYPVSKTLSAGPAETQRATPASFPGQQNRSAATVVLLDWKSGLLWKQQRATEPALLPRTNRRLRRRREQRFSSRLDEQMRTNQLIVPLSSGHPG